MSGESGAVEAVAEALAKHRVGPTGGGTATGAWAPCSCGHIAESLTRDHALIRAFQHQAEAAVAAARPAIEREARASALREARAAIRDRRRHMDQYGADEQYALALHDAWGLVSNLLRGVEREGQA